MLDRIINEFNEGKTVSRLSREYAIPYQTLRHRLLSAGVAMRSRSNRPNMSVLDRFEEKYIPEPNSGCWIWLAKIDKWGYGKFFWGRNITAQRASYKLFVGEIPDGMEIDHICKMPSCVNPDHLRYLTKQENLRGRELRQEKCRKGIHFMTAENIYLENCGATRRCKACRLAARKIKREMRA